MTAAIPPIEAPAASTQSDEALVRIEGVSKRFGPVLANDTVSFDIGRGRILALLGENGAGKSSIMNVLAGLYVADAGEIRVEGRPLTPGSPAASIAAGVGMVHQQFRLVETLTALENVLLATDRGALRLRRHPTAALQRLGEDLGFSIPWKQPVWQMPLAQRQQLEIFRVLACGARILILDEPTSVLSPVETERLFAIVTEIARSGRAVVLISHKLPEVRRLADDLVVMRAGRVVHAGPNVYRDSAADLDRLARLIVGDRLPAARARGTATPGPVVLRVTGLDVVDTFDRALVRGVDLEVRAGEVVALVGVAGNGQSELLDAVTGLRKPVRGAVEAPREAGRRGFAYAPAQHLGVALAPGLSVAENAILGRHRRPPLGVWLRRGPVAARLAAATALFGVKARAHDDVRQLSGGNQQRLVLGRELADDPTLIVAAYPTRGVDLATAIVIRNALVARAEAGAAVLFASEELEETMAIATRLLVMHAGRIVASIPAHEATAERIGRLMTGHEDAHAA